MTSAQNWAVYLLLKTQLFQEFTKKFWSLTKMARITQRCITVWNDFTDSSHQLSFAKAYTLHAELRTQYVHHAHPSVRSDCLQQVHGSKVQKAHSRQELEGYIAALVRRDTLAAVLLSRSSPSERPGQKYHPLQRKEGRRRLSSSQIDKQWPKVVDSSELTENLVRLPETEVVLVKWKKPFCVLNSFDFHFKDSNRSSSRWAIKPGSGDRRKFDAGASRCFIRPSSTGLHILPLRLTRQCTSIEAFLHNFFGRSRFDSTGQLYT